MTTKNKNKNKNNMTNKNKNMTLDMKSIYITDAIDENIGHVDALAAEIQSGDISPNEIWHRLSKISDDLTDLANAI